MLEEYVEEYVENRPDHQIPSLWISYDIFVGYFLIERSLDEDVRLFWIV
jgi:hypothetical protein